MFWMRRRKRPGNVQNPNGSAPRVLGPHPPSICLSRTVSTTYLLAGFSVFFLCAFSAPGLAGKEKKISRIVTGTVLDQADNGIVGATVVLTDLQTGKKNATYSQEGGRYQFADLQATHDYEVQANYKGLTSEARRVSSFDNRNTIVLNLKIPSPSS